MAVSGLRRHCTESLRCHAQCSVELTGEVLKSNESSQFNDGVVIEVAAKLLEVFCR